jgi:hypothetical protein
MQAIISSPSVSLALHVVREQRSPRVLSASMIHISFRVFVYALRCLSFMSLHVCVFASRVPRACLACLSYRSAFGAIMLLMFVCLPRASREHVWFACPTVPRSEPLCYLCLCLSRASREHLWFACLCLPRASRERLIDSMMRQ